MTRGKIGRQQRALERLTADIASDMAVGRRITFSQRMEYNSLKDSVSRAGLTHPGRI
jgi:hypothetical protein